MIRREAQRLRTGTHAPAGRFYRGGAAVTHGNARPSGAFLQGRRSGYARERTPQRGVSTGAAQRLHTGTHAPTGRFYRGGAAVAHGNARSSGAFLQGRRSGCTRKYTPQRGVSTGAAQRLRTGTHAPTGRFYRGGLSLNRMFHRNDHNPFKM
jgi:hypothetical protein